MNNKDMELTDCVAKKRKSGSVEIILTYWVADNREDGCGLVPVQIMFPRTAATSRATLEFAMDKATQLIQAIRGKPLTVEERRDLVLDFRDNMGDALKKARVKDE